MSEGRNEKKTEQIGVLKGEIKGIHDNIGRLSKNQGKIFDSLTKSAVQQEKYHSKVMQAITKNNHQCLQEAKFESIESDMKEVKADAHGAVSAVEEISGDVAPILKKEKANAELNMEKKKLKLSERTDIRVGIILSIVMGLYKGIPLLWNWLFN